MRASHGFLPLLACYLVAQMMGSATVLGEPRASGIAGSVQEERPLARMVGEYLTTSDSQRADELLHDIQREPGAGVDEIRAIINAGPRYRTQAVGTLPSQPVRVRGRQFWYGLFVPPSYTPDKTYALVICLHGAGFTGDSYLERWRTRLGENYMLACPTLIHGTWWTRLAEELVLSTIRAVRARYRIDANRMFLTGMSNGGIGAWLIGFHYAPSFAGIAPMAGGVDDVLFPFLQNLRHTPVYIIHGRKDQVMPVELSRSIAKTLSEYGYPVTYREHERSHPLAGAHFFPREELPDLVAWFDAQRRDPFPSSTTLVRDASHLKTFGWVRIDATDRIAAFTENLVEGRDEYIVNRVYAKLEARISAPNRIEVRTERVRRFTLFLSPELVDLSKPVLVVTNGRAAYEGPVTAQLSTLLREARLRQDWDALYPAQLSLAVESQE